MSPKGPPGFGPKVDKKKEELKAAIIPESERYSLRLERQEEDVLRQVLHAAQLHAGPGSQRLLRDQKKLHQLYQQLLRVGFSTASVESCLPQMRADATLNDALDWCCLHLPEAALPASFKVSRIGEGADEDSADRRADGRTRGEGEGRRGGQGQGQGGRRGRT